MISLRIRGQFSEFSDFVTELQILFYLLFYLFLGVAYLCHLFSKSLSQFLVLFVDLVCSFLYIEPIAAWSFLVFVIWQHFRFWMKIAPHSTQQGRILNLQGFLLLLFPEQLGCRFRLSQFLSHVLDFLTMLLQKSRFFKINILYLLNMFFIVIFYLSFV